MARSRIRSRGTGLSLDIQVDTAAADRAFRAVKRDIGRAFDQILANAAEHTVLPDAQRRAGNLKIEGDSTAAGLVVRKRRTAPFLTTRFRGRKGRAAGLQEFGGVVRTEIRPRRKKAVVVNGQPVARVTKARHYRAHKFLFGAVDANLDEFAQQARDDLVDIFARNGFEVT
jgi:hypothetical protein